MSFQTILLTMNGKTNKHISKYLCFIKETLLERHEGEQMMTEFSEMFRCYKDLQRMGMLAYFHTYTNFCIMCFVQSFRICFIIRPLF